MKPGGIGGIKGNWFILGPEGGGAVPVLGVVSVESGG